MVDFTQRQVLFVCIALVEDMDELLTVADESIKGPAFKKNLHPEYQSNDIESCLVLFPICPIISSNLPGFNLPFLRMDIGDL